MSRGRDLPAGNWPPYVQRCIRRGLWLLGVGLTISLAGTVLFGYALYCALQGRDLLGLDVFRASVGLISQLGISIFLALDLLVARKEHRSESTSESP